MYLCLLPAQGFLLVAERLWLSAAAGQTCWHHLLWSNQPFSEKQTSSTLFKQLSCSAELEEHHCVGSKHSEFKQSSYMNTLYSDTECIVMSMWNIKGSNQSHSKKWTLMWYQIVPQGGAASQRNISLELRPTKMKNNRCWSWKGTEITAREKLQKEKLCVCVFAVAVDLCAVGYSYCLYIFVYV